MLSASGLTFRAGSRLLIDNVSISFQPGVLHLIIGPNGAGKSTLVKLLSRMMRPHSGHIVYGTADVGGWSERELARRRAVLSQAIEVAFPIAISELVMMGRYPHFRARPGPSDERICQQAMHYFDVAEFANRNYATLSGGERQRVNFARVLAQVWEPVPGSSRYLFLDEPLTFLDIRHQIDFMQKVREFASQRDVVVIGVVHDLNLAAKFADRLILLHEGRILADGGKADVLTAQHLHTAFAVRPVLLTNSVTGETHLAFD
jgi:iron complex transport system ATP-binding protein